MKPIFSDHRLLIFFVLGLCALGFVAGAVAWNYKLPPAGFIRDALTAVDAWHEVSHSNAYEISGDDSEAGDVGDATAEKKITWVNGKTYDGYTLLSYRFSTTVELVDMQGNTVHTWDLPFAKIWPNAPHIHPLVNARIFIETAYVFPNGDLLAQYTGIGDTPYGYGLIKVDKSGKVLWRYADNAHHDFTVDNDGFIYAIVHKMQKTPVKGLEALTYPSLADYIVKLSPNGQEISRISLLEAFRDSEFALMLYSKPERYKAIGWDTLHTNSIRVLSPAMAKKFPMFKAGDMLVAMRSLDAIAVINPTEKRVVWMYHGSWHWPHAARFLDNGDILVLDNLGHISENKPHSKIVEFSPQTLQTKWSYIGTYNGSVLPSMYGRLQRLPNGNTLAVFAEELRAEEIAPDGKVVWSLDIVAPKPRRGLEYISSATRYAKTSLPFAEKK
jgi:hypothetical protein